jgi:hypothetical protein
MGSMLAGSLLASVVGAFIGTSITGAFLDGDGDGSDEGPGDGDTAAPDGGDGGIGDPGLADPRLRRHAHERRNGRPRRTPATTRLRLDLSSLGLSNRVPTPTT